MDSHEPCWELDDEGEDSEDECTDRDGGYVEDEVIEAGMDEWRSNGLHVELMVLAIEIGDDPRDEDWIPDSLRWKHNARIAQGKLSTKLKQESPLKICLPARCHLKERHGCG